jgi:hypothetical protein
MDGAFIVALALLRALLNGHMSGTLYWSWSSALYGGLLGAIASQTAKLPAWSGRGATCVRIFVVSVIGTALTAWIDRIFSIRYISELLAYWAALAYVADALGRFWLRAVRSRDAASNGAP